MIDKNKIYKIKDYWYLYPEKHRAALATGYNHSFVWEDLGEQYIAQVVVGLSKDLYCNVTYLSPKTILFPIETDGDYVKVISTEGVGWIIVKEAAKDRFKELKQE